MSLSINALLLIPLSVLAQISFSQADPCCQGAVRLVNGTGLIPLEGRVEVCNSGHWKTVCDDSWHTCDAVVVCAQLGFAREGSQIFRNAAYGQGSGLILEDVECQGTELLLSECSFRDSNDKYRECFHSEDSGIRCGDFNKFRTVPIINNCVGGELRLTNSTVVNEGRIEICINGVWGTICPPNNDSILDSTIVCKQLGFSEKGARSTVVHGGLMPTYIGDIRCTGNETKLIDCAHRKGTFTCSGCSSAGVHCNYDIAPAPQSFEVVIDYQNYANISWLPPNFLKSHGTLLGYSLNCSGTVIRNRVIKIETQNTTEEVQLLPHETYQCCVSAVNQAGVGQPSCALVATYYYEGVPTSAPTNVSWITLSNSSMLLLWYPPPIEYRNGYIREYHVKLYGNDTLNGLEALNYTTVAQFLTVEYLSPNIDYLCSIAAYTTSLGPYSLPIIVRLQLLETYDDCIHEANITQDSNINGSSVHAMIMSETDITETSDMNLKTDSEEELVVTSTLAALSGALVVIVIGMTGVFAAMYFCSRTHKTEESKEQGGDVIYETVDESKQKIRNDSTSISDRKKALRLDIVSDSRLQANIKQNGNHGSFPTGSHRLEDGTYQPLIPPRGENKDKNYQCLSPIEERIESLAQVEIDVGESQNDHDKEVKNTYQTLVHKEPKESNYQCLSPVQEYVKFVGHMESEGGDNKVDSERENKNTYQPLIKDEQIESSQSEYQALAEFTQQQNTPV